MCSRYQLSRDHYRAVLEKLGIPAPAAYLSRYNIAPGAPIPAARTSRRPPGREATALRWGLTPSWAKGDDPASRLINARAETLADKPSFRDALRTRRCVIPASGFYEWEQAGRARLPWHFRRSDGEPFAFAGLWDTWRAPDGEFIESCAVITTAPNAVMRAIHHRMPVMLTVEQSDAWLDPRLTEPAQLAPLLQPLADDAMQAAAVSSYVSNSQNEGPECLAAAETRGGPQLSFGFE